MALLLRLALAEQQLNAPTLDEHVTTLRHAVHRKSFTRRITPSSRGSSFHASPLMHQAKQALKIALDNWTVQHEPWDARIVLEAAIQSENRRAAEPVTDWIKSTKLQDHQLARLMGQFS